MDIEKILSPHKIADVTKIYHGLDHCCRCGCGGNYFERGSRGFTRAINALKKIEPLTKGTDMFTKDHRVCQCEGIDIGDNYVNIPVDADNDKCYCLYFD